MAAIEDNVFLSNLLPVNDADAAKSVLSVAAIFRLYWEEYRKSNQVTPRQYKVVNDILNCRTGSFGYSISACDNCGHIEGYFSIHVATAIARLVRARSVWNGLIQD